MTNFHEERGPPPTQSHHQHTPHLLVKVGAGQGHEEEGDAGGGGVVVPDRVVDHHRCNLAHVAVLRGRGEKSIYLNEKFFTAAGLQVLNEESEKISKNLHGLPHNGESRRAEDFSAQKSKVGDAATERAAHKEGCEGTQGPV